MAQLSFEQIRWLQTAEGREALAAAAGLRSPPEPRDVQQLREAFGAAGASAALTAAELRRRAQGRFRLADRMLFDSPEALEQATSEPVARHKAARFAGMASVADLCCGAGGDSLMVAQQAGRVVGVDRSPTRLACLRANGQAYGVDRRVSAVAADIGRWMPAAEAYHIDPPRREETGSPAGRGRRAGRRHRADEWGEWIGFAEQLARQRVHVAAKLSPAVDLAMLAWADEVELIGENGTLKQAVAWCGRLARARRSATVIRSAGGVITHVETIASDAPEPTPAGRQPLEPGAILHEPDAAVVRAQLLGNLAARIGAGLVDEHLPLLASAGEAEPTLLARRYEVLEVMGWSVKRLRPLLRARRWRVGEVKTRAFASRPEEILAQLKSVRADEDWQPVVLWAVRLGDRPAAILARRLGVAGA